MVNRMDPTCTETIVRRNEENADIFSDYLEGTFKPHPPTGLAEIPQVTNKHGAIIKLITPVDIVDTTGKYLNSEKAPGYDLIAVRILREL